MKEIMVSVLISLTVFACGRENFNGQYLGQKPPGMIPELFAEGIISTPAMENNIVFADKGREIYIERTDSANKGLFLYKWSESGWQEPVRIEFNDDGGQAHPTYNDHLGILVTMRRSQAVYQPSNPELSIRKRDGSTWGVATLAAIGMQGCVTDNGIIYTTIIDFSKKFFGHIARFIPDSEGYKGPEFLPAVINHPEFSTELPTIAPDESFMIFTTRRENDVYGRLYISYRDKCGNWKKPQNLSTVLKTPKQGHEWLATFSPDRKYLFYNVSGDIYWVDARIINELKNKK